MTEVGLVLGQTGPHSLPATYWMRALGSQLSTSVKWEVAAWLMLREMHSAVPCEALGTMPSPRQHQPGAPASVHLLEAPTYLLGNP